MDLRADATDLVGEIDLATLAGVIARCDLLVGSDTPLLQLAAAMGTPTVGLFGPTDGARGGAYGPAHRVVQAQAPPRYEDSATRAMRAWTRSASRMCSPGSRRPSDSLSGCT